MMPVHPRFVDALRILAVVAGLVVAAFALLQYLSTGRPDAREMRDLGLLLAFELALVPIAFSFLLPRQVSEAMVGEPLPRGTSVPNPWAY